MLDIAAGVGWTSALLSREKMISHVDALEFSLHRINNIAPIVIDGFNGEKRKISRILGSFYDIKGKDYDIMFMSQAFHHSDNPLKLLYECDKS